LGRNSWSRTFGAAVFALIVTCGCQSETAKVDPPPQTAFRYEQQIGVAKIQRGANQGCLALVDPSIKPGTKITLVDQPAETLLSQTAGVNESSVVERLSQDCDDGHMFTTELSASGPAYYRIQTVKEWQGNSYLIAIADPSGPVAVKEGGIEGDLDGDGTKESFRVCTSGEGVHYQVWTGEPLKGRPRWHWYVYAGYDTASSCTEKEYFGPK
jgi:hypothetical protein